ncbi:kinase-like domain, phloem protein 2-like protein, partial [Tanacetum coccineum]
FVTVVEMLDITYLNIEIKSRAQVLSPNVVYGVYLVFKFYDSRNFSSKPMCGNLKYRKGHESMHAYFATWKDEQWMMIEFHRFLSQKEDVVPEFLLESFSSYYCGDVAVYVEGIEFQPIDKVKHEEIGKLKEVQQVLKSDFKVDQVQQLPTNFEEIFKVCRNYDELFWLDEVDGKKLLVVSVKAALYKFSNVETFTLKPPAQSRFQEVIELLLQQVFHINCTIRSQMLSPDTEYVCNLLFKLSENCRGMHYPVKVGDVLHQENKEAEFLYFITPEPRIYMILLGFQNKGKIDGWMEIQLLFNACMILFLRSCSLFTKKAIVLCPEKFTEEACIFSGCHVNGDGNPAGIDHLDELSSIVMITPSYGKYSSGSINKLLSLFFLCHVNSITIGLW